MLKIERRFEKGKLSIKDLNKWASGNSPKEAFFVVQNFWGAFDIKMPKIVTDSKITGFDFTYPDRVSIGVEEILEQRKVFERTNYKLSLDAILRTTLGEEYTHYIHYAKAPENFENEEKILYEWICGRFHKAFENYAALNVQIEGIGSLGRKEVDRNLGLSDYDKFQQKKLEIGSSKTNEEFRKNSPMVLPVLNKLSSSGGYANLNENELRVDAYFADFIHNTMSGAGQYVVASELEKKWSGRFPQLIKTVLEPKKEFGDMYFEFIGTWFPNLKQFLEVYLL